MSIQAIYFFKTNYYLIKYKSQQSLYDQQVGISLWQVTSSTTPRSDSYICGYYGQDEYLYHHKFLSSVIDNSMLAEYIFMAGRGNRLVVSKRNIVLVDNGQLLSRKQVNTAAFKKVLSY